MGPYAQFEDMQKFAGLNEVAPHGGLTRLTSTLAPSAFSQLIVTDEYAVA